jgi:glucose dehydrogenase
MNTFKTPSRVMAATIALVLLGLFGVVLLAPMFSKDISFDPALVQTLLTLTVIAVGYYLGTSNASQAKDETIHAQAKAAEVKA